MLKNKYKAPVPYNGMFARRDTLEVTYENERPLEFYDTNEKLKYEMSYMYKYYVSKEDYKEFWESYKERYFKLKEKYRKAYKITYEYW